MHPALLMSKIVLSIFLFFGKNTHPQIYQVHTGNKDYEKTNFQTNTIHRF